MSQGRVIRKSERVAGGYRVTIEVTNAYSDGSSRLDRVFVPESEVASGDPNDVLEAVAKAALDGDPVAKVRGVDVVEYRAVKAAFGGNAKAGSRGG